MSAGSLQVRVERDDDAPARRAEARGEGSGLPGVRGERHDVDLRVLALQRLEDVERAVRRAVVHRHDLVAPIPYPHSHPTGQHSVDLLDQDGQILALIVHRDDQRELKRGGHT